jgi:cyclopropane-fatty-acyl-phospholipid synthase
MVMPIVERNLVPDALIRMGIRQELSGDLQRVRNMTITQQKEKEMEFVDEIKTMPIAIAQASANEQHYEVSDEFYRLVLGSQLKYSCCYFNTPDSTLDEAENAMFELYCSRAELEDGMNLIDLGCGWGSLTFYLAQRYPHSKITSISNSKSQKAFIDSTAQARGLTNITVMTGDISTFDLPYDFYNTFDRILSIEMFEHMKNYQLLFEKLARWLRSSGKIFIHIFVAKSVPGHYSKGWMSETFFTGGTLPSDSLLLYFQQEIFCERQWRINGTHYSRTLEAWLLKMDQVKEKVLPVLSRTYGEENSLKWYVNWRLFFMACSEFFGMAEGEEYYVSHYLFMKK